MNFKEAYAEDLENAFFDADEFGEEHTIDGKKMVIVKTEAVLKDAGYVLKGNFNPHEDTQNAADHTIYIRKADAKRHFTANSRINIDGVAMFVKNVRLIAGMIELTVGKNV